MQRRSPEGRVDLAAIEIGKRHYVGFGEAKRIFDGRRHAAHFWLTGAAAQHRRYFDLGLHAIGMDEELCDYAFRL
jgi:hypothetical protein